MPTNDVTPDFSRLFAEYKELQRTHFPDVDEMPEAVIDRLQEIEDTIATTPAATLADAAVKVELLAFWQREGVAAAEGVAGQPARGGPCGRSFIPVDARAPRQAPRRRHNLFSQFREGAQPRRARRRAGRSP
jgi:hypothetical protein